MFKGIDIVEAVSSLALLIIAVFFAWFMIALSNFLYVVSVVDQVAK